MSCVLVTGGAGYIGSHMVKALTKAGHDVTVFDNLSTGHRDTVGNARLIVGDLTRKEDIATALNGLNCDVVMHFAACCYVGESVLKPDKYYFNNVIGTLNLLDSMHGKGVEQLVFSSSCSTYGDPVSIPMSEEHPQQPVNPYGATKLAAERAMADYGRAFRLRTVAFRYFNAAGCDPDGQLGERHDPETHIIPLVIQEALRVRAGGEPAQTRLQVFGNDFDTRDGTCIRDFVHVSDLCEAHLLALDRVKRLESGAFEAYNLGVGKGHTVMEVIAACREVTGQDIRYQIAPRRAGDPSALVAASTRARAELGWTPRHTTIADIVATAWNWFAKRDLSQKRERHNSFKVI